jgi:hypothetical protein
LTLNVGACCLAVIRGLPMDQASFYQLLDRLRLCPPRPRK